MTQFGPEWYDQAMLEDGSPALLDGLESPWALMYQEIARLILPHEHVVDLGCGTGRFIKALLDQAHYAPIVGVDFAPRVLAEAAEHIGAADNVALELSPLEAWWPANDIAGNTVFTCMEVLEHLAGDFDLELTQRIPPGHRLIFSVPSYWSQSHVRWYQDVAEVFRRFQTTLDLRRWIYVPVDERKYIHVVEAFRRSATW